MTSRQHNLYMECENEQFNAVDGKEECKLTVFGIITGCGRRQAAHES